MPRDPELPALADDQGPIPRFPPIATDEIDTILKRPNGWYVLLEMVQMGRIDAEVAVSAIENARRPPFFERLIHALLSTISSR